MKNKKGGAAAYSLIPQTVQNFLGSIIPSRRRQRNSGVLNTPARREVVLSPNSKRAGMKLLAKRDRKKFKNTQKALNTRSYRMGNNLKVNSSNLLGNHFNYFVNPDLIDVSSRNIISGPGNSASGSVVMLFKSKETDHQYVLKVTGLKSEDAMELVDPGRPMNFPELECEIYKEVSKLVRKNITPHTFTLLNNSLNIKRINLPDNNYFRLEGLGRNVQYLSIMLNETSSGNSELYTLSKFINRKLIAYSDENILKIMYNILFQIIYTLEVFNRVGIMHNDLHIGNIFIVIKNNRFDQPNYRKTFRKYRFKSTDGTQYEMNLENIGFDVRIYDYDRSHKFGIPGTIFPKTILTSKLELFQSVNEFHTHQNPYFDTFKILCHIYNDFNRKLPSEFLDRIIHKYFIEPDLLLTGKVGTKDFLMSDRIKYEQDRHRMSEAQWMRGFYLINSEPVGFMMTTEEILLDLVTDPEVVQHLSGTEAQVPVIETYDMDGINVDIHGRDKRRAQRIEFSKIPGKRRTRRASVGGPRNKRQTTRRPRRKSVARLNARKNKKRKGKRKGKINSNNINLENSNLVMGSNKVFENNSWVEVDEYGRMNNNRNNRDLEAQKRLEKGAEAFYFPPQVNNNNPFA